MTEQAQICEERPTGKRIVGFVSLGVAGLMLAFDLLAGNGLTAWPLLTGGVGVGALINAHIDLKRWEAQAKANPNACAAPPPEH